MHLGDSAAYDQLKGQSDGSRRKKKGGALLTGPDGEIRRRLDHPNVGFSGRENNHPGQDGAVLAGSTMPACCQQAASDFGLTYRFTSSATCADVHRATRRSSQDSRGIAPVAAIDEVHAASQSRPVWPS